MTAYFGLLDIGRPEPGQTVVVSAAAGGVGSLVAQIAKLKGCRVVGIAGGLEKCTYLVDEVGADAAIDYKRGAVAAELSEYCPAGVDVYFDNVGGDVLDEVLPRLARNGRVVLCGAISQYNSSDLMKGPSQYWSLIVKRASMTGFLVTDYVGRYGAAMADMRDWISAGKVVPREFVGHGLDAFPRMLGDVFGGRNIGKTVLKLG